MKAILVIDMPMNCLECRFRITHYANDKPYLDTCMVKDETCKNGCPLRPMSEEASNILLQGLDHMEELKNVKVHYFNDLMEEENEST